MAEKEHRAQDYAEGGLNLKINFRKLKSYVILKDVIQNASQKRDEKRHHKQ